MNSVTPVFCSDIIFGSSWLHHKNKWWQVYTCAQLLTKHKESFIYMFMKVCLPLGHFSLTAVLGTTCRLSKAYLLYSLNRCCTYMCTYFFIAYMYFCATSTPGEALKIHPLGRYDWNVVRPWIRIAGGEKKQHLYTMKDRSAIQLQPPGDPELSPSTTLPAGGYPHEHMNTWTPESWRITPFALSIQWLASLPDLLNTGCVQWYNTATMEVSACS